MFKKIPSVAVVFAPLVIPFMLASGSLKAQEITRSPEGAIEITVDFDSLAQKALDYEVASFGGFFCPRYGRTAKQTEFFA